EQHPCEARDARAEGSGDRAGGERGEGAVAEMRHLVDRHETTAYGVWDLALQRAREDREAERESAADEPDRWRGDDEVACQTEDEKTRELEEEADGGHRAREASPTERHGEDDARHHADARRGEDEAGLLGRPSESRRDERGRSRADDLDDRARGDDTCERRRYPRLLTDVCDDAGRRHDSGGAVAGRAAREPARVEVDHREHRSDEGERIEREREREPRRAQ